MAERTAPDRSYVPPDGPSDVEVTITVRPRTGRRKRPEQFAATVAARPRAALALVIAIAAIAAIATIALDAGRPAAGGAHGIPARDAQLAGIGVAYGYPPQCLSVTVSASNRAYVSVHVDHRAGCLRYHGIVRVRSLLAPDEVR
jgi:hypothetical protein